MSNSYQLDCNEQEILLSADSHQVMMEWEKIYMQKSIDMLKPTGHVLEIGFGCGYSATQILQYPILSYTVIECDAEVIKKAKEWTKKYTTQINIVEGTWQAKLYDLGIFDAIYFDDFPLNLTDYSTDIDKIISNKRLHIFLDLCIQNHTKIGSKISFYLDSTKNVTFSSNIMPFIKTDYKIIDIAIPANCKYRDLKNQKCLIPLVTKVADYDFNIANSFALQEVIKSVEK